MRPLRQVRSRFRWTVRVRLTLAYGLLFLVVGAGMLVFAQFIFGGGSDVVTVTRDHHVYTLSTIRVASVGTIKLTGQPFITGSSRPTVVAAFSALRQPPSELPRLVKDFALALVPMYFVALGLGWLVAGRALRPLRTMTRTARSISARNLHERLASTGPHDELRELSDTFDELLGRLEASFEAQRRFVHHASHELRTPITRQRTMLEVTLADPDASVTALREMADRVLATGEEQERLIEGLLTLAKTDELTSPLELVDLAAIATEVMQLRSSAIAERKIELTTEIEPAAVEGDAGMIERLMANIIDNAIEHNFDGGSITASIAPTQAGACFTVRNTGHAVRPDEAMTLLHPLEHRHDDSRSARRHHGLGLAIVQAIATVHGASLRLRPLEAGGLEVAVDFTAALGAAQQSGSALRSWLSHAVAIVEGPR